MSLPKLGTRERAHLGLRGTPGEDYTVQYDALRVHVRGAFLLDNPSQPVEVARPGDVVVIWSNTQLAPDQTVAVGAAHPALTRAGFCSYPAVFTDDHFGPVSMLFRCEQEVSLTELPWFLTVFSMGKARQS